MSKVGENARMPLAIYVLGLGIFSVTTSEFMVSGLLPQMAGDFGVSVSQVGYLVTAYAGAMTVGGPLLTVGLLKLPPKTALLLLVAVFFVGQSLGAMAGSYGVMVVARVVTGAAASAFFGVSIAIAAEIVGEELRGRAASVVVGGLMIGTVFGLPGATLLGQSFGWRASFWGVAILALVVGAVVMRTVPALGRQESVSLRGELAAFRSGRLWAAYLTSMLIIGATFSAFSYFAPIFTEVGGFDAGTVPLLLVVYGAATVIGNIVVGRLADRYTMGVMAVGLTSIALTLSAFALFGEFGENQVAAVASIIVLGLVGVTMNPAMGVRVMRAANARPLVNTVHTAVITFGIVVGSSLGGLTISAGFGLTSPLWVGAGLAVAGLASIAPFIIPVPGKNKSSTEECECGSTG